LYAISRWNFLLFHCLAETQAIVVGAAICMIYWNTRQLHDIGAYLVIGLGCLFGGLFDVVYVFAYPGMPVFPASDGNLAMQATTVANWYVSLSCLAAVPLLRHKVNAQWALLLYSSVAALVAAALFLGGPFPDCYVAGVGFTAFARIGAAISCSGYLGALLLLASRRRALDGRVFRLFAAALAAFLAGNLAAIAASDLNGFARTATHLCQVVAVSLGYAAFVEVGLQRPYELLLRSQQQSAETLQIILDSVPASVFYKDKENRFLRVNKHFADMMEMPREQLEGRSLFDLHPREQAEAYWRDDQEVIASGVPKTNIIEPVQTATQQRWLQTDKLPYRDAQGQIIGVIGFAVDITARKRVEGAMAETISRLRATLESTADGILVVDLEGRIVDFNDRFLEMWQLPKDLIPAGKQRDLVSSPGDRAAMQMILGRLKDPQQFIARVQELYAAPEQSSFDTLQWKDGRVFERYSQPQRIEGRPVGRVWSFRDVTDRRAAEQALSASEARYRSLVETIPQLTWRASADGEEVDCNRRWSEYTGQTPAQAQSYGWLTAVHPDDRSRVMDEMRQAAARRAPYEVECRLCRAADGSYRWHLARAVPLLGDDGQVAYWFGSATDIEELKQAQQVLQCAHEEQLERHRAELAHVGRLSMMGEMAAGLAHELKQPLHAINNYAGGALIRLQRTPAPDQELLAALERIGEEATRTAEIIHRVKGFVQKNKPQACSVSLNKLVEQVVLLSKAEVEQRQVEVALDLSADLPPVVADPVQIEQVIMNLVRNGLEAMDETPAAERRLRIQTMRHGAATVQLAVCDQGKGIVAEKREKVFEPFFTTKPNGMGMGLAISRSIVQAHGGRLWITADQPQGCTFHMALPLEQPR
jgi:PAS domain S-box-containing protein